VSLPIVFGILAFAVTMLFEKHEGIPRIFLWWLFACIILFSPFRYIFLQVLLATAYPFQSIYGLISTFWLSLYIPIVFSLLYAIGLGIPFLIIVSIIGKKDPLPKYRIVISGICAPLIFTAFSVVYYLLLPYAAYSTHWVSPKALIRSTNGPSHYYYEYVVEQFTPLEFPNFATEIGLEEMDAKERLRAHVAGVYCGNKQFWYYVSNAYPLYYQMLEREYKKTKYDNAN